MPDGTLSSRLLFNAVNVKADWLEVFYKSRLHCYATVLNLKGDDMTRQEFYDKYGDVKVKFASYYKYTFTYEATLPDGRRLTCGYGGDSDDIYRHEVSADCEETVGSLQPYQGVVYQDGIETESFYDY